MSFESYSEKGIVVMYVVEKTMSQGFLVHGKIGVSITTSLVG